MLHNFIVGIPLSKTLNIGILKNQTFCYDNICIKFCFYDMKHKNDKYNNNKGNGSIHCLKLKYLKFNFACKQFINLQIHRNKRNTISWVSTPANSCRISCSIFSQQNLKAWNEDVGGSLFHAYAMTSRVGVLHWISATSPWTLYVRMISSRMDRLLKPTHWY